jgi:hypothetical protein
VYFLSIILNPFILFAVYIIIWVRKQKGYIMFDIALTTQQFIGIVGIMMGLSLIGTAFQHLLVVGTTE